MRTVGELNFFISVFLISQIACLSKNEKIAANDKQSSTEVLQAKMEKFDKRYLDGAWWRDNSDPSAVFIIEEDSLFYAENDLACKVMISGDTMRWIFEDDSILLLIKKLNQDTLNYYNIALKRETMLFKKR